MKPVETVSLIGLGALGASYLSRIAEHIPMEQIRVIAQGERAGRYRQNGVAVNGRTYHFPVTEPGEDVEPADLMLFVVKYHHLDQAIKQAEKHIGPDTVILSLLNGIDSEERIGAVYGMERILYSLVIGIDAVREGDETSYTNLGLIPFGEPVNKPGEYSQKVRRVQEFFDRTEVPYQIPEDMMCSLWRKYLLNTGVNQVSAMLRAPYAAFQREGGPRELMQDAMEEVYAIAQKAGINLPWSEIEGGLKILATLNPAGKTSMLQDMEARRKTEVEMFSGILMELGERYGVDVPVNRMLFRMIKASEEVFGLPSRQ